jgi:protein-tyrosine phosphatase
MTSVYWIQHSRKPRLAIVARPRADARLADDLLALKRAGIDILVTLLEEDEAAILGLEEERELAEKNGLEFRSYPIPDRTTPGNRVDFCKLISYLADAIRAGKHVGAHCRGCIGRSTVTTAAVLVELGWDAGEALAIIEEARGCPVPDTEEQQRWILQLTPCSPQSTPALK